MSKKLAELRVIAKYNGEYASTVYVTQDIRGDIYCGKRIPWAEEVGVRELFRESYHRDGSTWLRLPGGPHKTGVVDCPHDLKGILQLGQVGPDLNYAEFHRMLPKSDTRTRRSLIVDLQDVFPNQFTASVYAFEPGRSDLFYAEISQFKE